MHIYIYIPIQYLPILMRSFKITCVQVYNGIKPTTVRKFDNFLLKTNKPYDTLN